MTAKSWMKQVPRTAWGEHSGHAGIVCTQNYQRKQNFCLRRFLIKFSNGQQVFHHREQKHSQSWDCFITKTLIQMTKMSQ